jgi:DNA-directed RNA polymerase subunit RPC12/RpoP
MDSTKEDSVVISCPGCGARFAVTSSMVGRRARCAACDKPFIVPAAKPPREPKPELPPHIGFECRVCGTRMYGHSKDVGKKLKCDDCGALNVVPPPPAPKPKNIPAALEGEQYELWEPEEQPLPSEILAAQPKYIALKCRRCDTVMHGTEKQVGQLIACPDCGTKNIVPSPPKPVSKPSVLAPASQTPKLDPDAHPGERPFVSVPMPKMLHEEEHEAEYAAALEKSKRTGKPMEIDSRGRPIMPRFPLVQGVLPFLLSPGVPVAWVGLSVGFVAAGWVFRMGLEYVMQGEMATIAGMCFIALSFGMAVIFGAILSSVVLQIIMESSEGNRQIHHWPGLLDWFANLFYLGISISMSILPGWAVGQIPPLNTEPGLAILLGSVSLVVCIPMVILSQLDINSPFGIASGRMLGSLLRCPFSWAFFYLEWLAIVVICDGATYLAAKRNPELTIWILPLWVAGIMLFARLLGRLAWRLADAMAVETKS